MTEITENTYVNAENIVMAQEINGNYYITLASGNVIMVSQEVYESIIK